MCASPPGAAAATLAVFPSRIDARAHVKGGCLRRFCRRRNFVRQCSRVNLAVTTQNRAPGRFEGRKLWRFAREEGRPFRYRQRMVFRSIAPYCGAKTLTQNLNCKTGHPFGFASSVDIVRLSNGDCATVERGMAATQAATQAHSIVVSPSRQPKGCSRRERRCF